MTDTLNPKTKEDYREALAEMRWRFVQAVVGLQDIQALTNKSDATMRGVYDEAERILHALSPARAKSTS